MDASELRALLPMEKAVDALEAAFGARRLPAAPLRTRVEGPDGTLLLMPASDEAGMGVKLVTLNPANPGRGLPFVHAVYVLFAGGSLAPAAIIDGGALTALRTAAVSALATRYLARVDAARLVLFGAGVQAAGHLEAMRAVRPIRRVTIVSRTRGRAEALVERAGAMGLEAEVGDPGTVTEADIVCTCTTSPDPVVDGSTLPPGCHVNAVGSYQPTTRELDDEAMRSASLVVVETREAALSEAGELVMGLENGALASGSVVELADVIGGRAGRRGPDEITVFKSVGIAFEDLVVARAAVASAPGGAHG